MACSKKACIVFFDEVDAIGGARFDDGVSVDEFQRTMLEIANQLDRFDARGNIEVLAATNRPPSGGPPSGGPPSLPEYSDAILSALNLYRYILITESTGNSNCMGILSKDKVHKAYNEWLLPLRTLVARSEAESQKDSSMDDILCAFNPLQLVLYRCIELVEAEEKKLKHS